MSVQAGNFYAGGSGQPSGSAQQQQGAVAQSAAPLYAAQPAAFAQAPFQYAPMSATGPPPGYWAYAPYGTNGQPQGVGDGTVMAAPDVDPALLAVPQNGALPVAVARGMWSVAEAEKEVPAAIRERDLKLQRRKEANRESARRSKQRKKEESEQLARRAQELAVEGETLRAELTRLKEHCLVLECENNTLRAQVHLMDGSAPPAPRSEDVAAEDAPAAKRARADDHPVVLDTVVNADDAAAAAAAAEDPTFDVL